MDRQQINPSLANLIADADEPLSNLAKKVTGKT